MVDEKKKMTYWCLCLLILFVIFVLIEWVITGGFASFGTKILTPWLNATFGDYSVYVQGVLSVVVIILLILVVWFARKKGWF